MMRRMPGTSPVPEMRRPWAEPTIFRGGPGRQLAGFYHAPAEGHARSPGVVLCNPLGYEAMSAHRTIRHLAERLGAAGLPALRFDYRGTGDSSGSPRDPRIVAAWVDDVRAAVRELRERSGARSVALVGMRFGASLATVAAGEESDVEALVLWAPVVSGRAQVRALRAFRMLKEPKAKRADGGEEVGGYYFARETLADLSALELLARADHDVARVLVVSQGEQPAPDESALAEHWRAARAEVRVAAASGFAPMMRDDPYESVVPAATLDSIVSWLAEGAARPIRAPQASPARPSVLTVDSAEPTVRETPLRFGNDERLFGVLSEPERPPSKARPAVLLLNVGADAHAGPHRMNTEMGRELSQLGHVALRFDVGGLGESAAGPGKAENRLYQLDSVDDVRSAMDLLEARCGCAGFVLVGLCSGAFLAYHAAVNDPRVVAQVLVNMFAFEWNEGDPVAPVERQTYASSRFYARALLDRHVWARALKGEVDVRGIAAVVARRHGLRLAHGVRAVGARILGRRGQTPVERALQAMCDRGVQTLMVFSESDGGLDMIARYLGTDARRLSRRRGFALQVVSGVDHTFASIAAQEQLRSSVYRFLARQLP